MDALSDIQKHLIAQIIANPDLSAATETTRRIGEGNVRPPGIESLGRVVPPRRLTVDQVSTNVVTTPLAEPDGDPWGDTQMTVATGEGSKPGYVAAMLGKPYIQAGRVNFRTTQIDFLLAAFVPLFDDTRKRNLISKHLDPCDYNEIGTHVVHALRAMLVDKKSHHMQVLGGLAHAIIEAVDEGIVEKGTHPENLDELLAVAKLLAAKATSSPSVRQQLWRPPPHLDPMVIRGITDTVKRTQLYQDLNTLAMNRITPLLTERSLAFASRANVRPVPLSKNERSFFFQLMTVFPLHGTDKELRERIALWIAAIPCSLKRTRAWPPPEAQRAATLPRGRDNMLPWSHRKKKPRLWMRCASKA